MLAKKVCQVGVSIDCPSDPEAVGQLLWAENAASFRLGTKTEPSHPFVFEDVDITAYSNAELLRSLFIYRWNCLDQSSWKDSIADVMSRELFIRLALPYVDTDAVYHFIYNDVFAHPELEKLDFSPLKPKPSVSLEKIEAHVKRSEVDRE